MPCLETALPGDEHFRAALRVLWSETRGDPSICVAVLDGPIDLSHQSLRSANITRSVPAIVTPRGAALRHGTHVASVIFGRAEGPVHGLAPYCHGISIPLFVDAVPAGEPACSQMDLAAAVTRAVD